MPAADQDTVRGLWAEYSATGSIDTDHARNIVRNAFDVSAPYFSSGQCEAMEFALLSWAGEPWLRELFNASWPKFPNPFDKRSLLAQSLSVYALDDTMTTQIIGLIGAEPPKFRHEFLWNLFDRIVPWRAAYKKDRIWRERIEPRIMNRLLPFLLLREEFTCLVVAALNEDPEGPLARRLEKWPERFIAATEQSATTPVWRHFDGVNHWCEFPPPKRLCGRGFDYDPPDLHTRERLIKAAQLIAALLPSRPPDLTHATAIELVAQFQAIETREYPIAFYAHGNGDESMERETRLHRFVTHACETASPDALAEAMISCLRHKLYFPPRRGEGADWHQYTACGWRAEAWRYLTKNHWTVTQAIAFADEAVTQSRAERPPLRGPREREAVIELATSYPGDPEVGAFLREHRAAPDLWGMVDELLVDLRFGTGSKL